MQILLCAATEFEIKPTIDLISNKALSNVDVLVTGVGLTAATYHLTKAVMTRRPDLVIQAGVAGSLDDNLALVKVVVVKNESIGDLGVNENGKFNSVFEMNLQDKDVFPWKDRKLVNESVLVIQTGLEVVEAVTVNEITTSKEKIAYYRNELNAKVESMEGAALHYVCLQENVSFLQVRSLSNFAGERDKNKWQLNEAIVSLNSELQRIIKLLNQ